MPLSFFAFNSTINLRAKIKSYKIYKNNKGKELKIKLSLIACIFTTISFASEVCKTDSDDMLSQLLLKHPSVKMSQEAIKGAKYKVDSAFWNYFPTPSVDFSARDEGRNTTVARVEQPL